MVTTLSKQNGGQGCGAGTLLKGYVASSRCCRQR
jgi:hypothetical protein